MKRLFALAALLAIFATMSTAYADYPKKAFLQHFTSASCPPCASTAPGYYAWVKQNTDKAVSISFHGNFNRDEMENHYSAAARQYFSYYGQKGKVSGVPSLVVQGKTKSYPTAQNFLPAVNAAIAETTPISITIDRSQTGIKNDVTVTLNSTRKYLQDMHLRVAVVEGYHYYENAGTNGEKNFFTIVRDMLPDPTGTAVRLNANEQVEFDYTFDLHPEWYPNMIYIVAWIQDETNSDDVLQVASTQMPNLSNIETKPRYTINMTAPQRAFKVQEMTEISKPVTITNPNSFPVRTAFSIVGKQSNIPEDWTVSLDKTEQVIPAGGSVVVNVSVTPGYESALGYVTVGAFPMETFDVPMSNSYSLYFMSEDIRYVIFNSGMSNYGPALYNHSLSATIYADKLAVLPFSDDIINSFTADDFDVAFFMTTSMFSPAFLPYLIPAHIQYIKEMLSKGKNVFVASDASGFVANHPQAPAETKDPINDFFTNVAKIKFEAQASWMEQVSANQYSIISFTVNGAHQDTITGNFVSTFNTTNQLFTPHTEIFSIPEGSPAIPINFYNQDLTKIAGVRVEGTNGSKLVYLGYPLEVASSMPMQKTMLENSMRWFVGAPEVFKPDIITDYSSLAFGQVKIGEYKDMELEVMNIGNADLKISKLEIKNDTEGVFAIIEEGDDTIEPLSSTMIKVRFTPVEETNYTFRELIIMNNDNTFKNLTIQLTGTGVLPEATGPRVKLSAVDADFGTIEAIEAFEDREFVITNTGIADLSLTEIRLENNADEAFRIISLPPTGAIAPSASYTIRVRFEPQTDGTFQSDLAFTANDPDQQYFELSLVGVATPHTSVVDNMNALSVAAAPNPFANSTNIKLSVPENLSNDVNVSLIDATGKQVALIINGAIAPGEHNVKFDGSFLPNGTYYLVSRIGNKTSSTPIVIVR